jgi:hypothetical protein
VTSDLLRKLTALLMTACAGGQAAAGLLILVGTLTLGLHEGDHPHGVSLVSEGGHFQLVLSHVEDRRADDRHDEGLLHGIAAFSESDHVLHLESGGVANAASRRADSTPCAALGAAAAPASPHAPTPVRHLRPEPPDLGTERLRTTVLRL